MKFCILLVAVMLVFKGYAEVARVDIDSDFPEVIDDERWIRHHLQGVDPYQEDDSDSGDRIVARLMELDLEGDIL